MGYDLTEAANQVCKANSISALVNIPRVLTVSVALRVLSEIVHPISFKKAFRSVREWEGSLPRYNQQSGALQPSTLSSPQNYPRSIWHHWL